MESGFESLLPSHAKISNLMFSLVIQMDKRIKWFRMSYWNVRK